MGNYNFRAWTSRWIQSKKVHCLAPAWVRKDTAILQSSPVAPSDGCYVHEFFTWANAEKCHNQKINMVPFFRTFCISKKGLFLYNYHVQAACYVCEESLINFTSKDSQPPMNLPEWHDSFLGHLCSSTIINQREHQPYQHQMPASEHRILSQCPISLAVALSMNGKLVRFNSFNDVQ